MGETKIEWATHTANWQAGCTRASPACQHCYAEIMSARQEAIAYARGDERLFNRYEGVTENRRWTGKITFDADALSRAFTEMWRSRKPRRVFCGSMTDLFHDNAPREAQKALAEEIHVVVEHYHGGRLEVRGPTWPHVIMLLTKRPANLARWQAEHFPDGLPSWVWVGTTVENQEWADRRVPELLEVAVQPGGVRYLSMEPLLGAVDLAYTCFNGADSLGTMPGIHWVIVGGESGHGARPMHPQWARDLCDQCAEAGVPYFMKQTGAWTPVSEPREGDEWIVPSGESRGPWIPGDTGEQYIGGVVMRRTNGHGSDLLDGVEHKAFPGQPSSDG